MSTVQSRFFWTWRSCRERDSYVWWLHWKNKTKHWLTLVILTGCTSSHKDRICWGEKLISDSSPCFIKTPVFSALYGGNCLRWQLSSASRWWQWPTQPLHYVGSDCRPAADWTVVLFSLPVGCYRTLMAFSLWWCLVDGVQGGPISGLHSRPETKPEIWSHFASLW